MAKENLIPLRIKIRYGQRPGRPEHGYLYPDFDQVSDVIRKGMRWQKYLDTYGSGWIYDGLSDVGDTDTYSSDPSVRFGLVLVPVDFADAALALYPEDCEELTEVQVEEFVDQRAFYNRDIEERDQAALLEAQLLQARGRPEDIVKVNKILDPNDSTPGVRISKLARWAEYSEYKRLVLHSRVPKKPGGAG